MKNAVENLTVESLSRLATEQSIDARPLAAFGLGFHAFAGPGWQTIDVGCGLSQCESTEASSSPFRQACRA